MKLLWHIIRGMLKIGVIAGLFLAALVLAIWGLERSGVITFRPGFEQHRSFSLANDAGAKASSAKAIGADADTASSDTEAADREAKAALRRLTGQARAAQAEAEHEYKRLRSRVNAIISARSEPAATPDAQARIPPDTAASDDVAETVAAAETAPDYRGLKDRLEGLGSGLGRASAPKETPAARPPSEPPKPVDAPQYQDLKQRLAEIMEANR